MQSLAHLYCVHHASFNFKCTNVDTCTPTAYTAYWYLHLSSCLGLTTHGPLRAYVTLSQLVHSLPKPVEAAITYIRTYVHLLHCIKSHYTSVYTLYIIYILQHQLSVCTSKCNVYLYTRHVKRALYCLPFVHIFGPTIT